MNPRPRGIHVRMWVLLIVLVGVVSGISRPAAQSAQTRTVEPEVRMVYLVPSDRAYRGDYAQAIENAIRDVQIWYQDQMGNGETFSLDKTVVQPFVTPHPASWYATNDAGSDQSLWFWFKALADGFALTGGGFNDPNNRWVFYIDADPACGQATGAAAGVALLPANDLRGLVGEANVPPCVGQPPDTKGLCRWFGGLGHELGHALGLPHPVPCPGGATDGALMCLGYITFPDTYLLPADKASLGTSPFLSPLHTLNVNRMSHFGCGVK